MGRGPQREIDYEQVRQLVGLVAQACNVAENAIKDDLEDPVPFQTDQFPSTIDAALKFARFVQLYGSSYKGQSKRIVDELNVLRDKFVNKSTDEFDKKVSTKGQEKDKVEE